MKCTTYYFRPPGAIIVTLPDTSVQYCSEYHGKGYCER